MVKLKLGKYRKNEKREGGMFKDKVQEKEGAV
jgi:hypothetical protein